MKVTKRPFENGNELIELIESGILQPLISRFNPLQGVNDSQQAILEHRKTDFSPEVDQNRWDFAGEVLQHPFIGRNVLGRSTKLLQEIL
ncbi:hypothetical protein D9M70_483020 [compost metagenome]